MSVQRLEKLDIDHRELFTAIYGLNSSSEYYITEDLRIHNVREALYLYLKEQGYSVIFYDDKAFSYEEGPLLKFFNFTARKETASPAPAKRDFFKGKGPMSRSRNMSAVSNASNVADSTESHHDSIHVESFGNQRRFIVYQSEGIFKDIFAFSQKHPNEKLAVVFVSPSTLTFDDEQRKVIINRWKELTADFRRNKLALRIIGLYFFDSPRDFAEAFDNAHDELLFLSPFKDMIRKDIGREDKETGQIIENGRKDTTIYYLGDPERDEISNMLNHRRLLFEDGLPALFGKIPWDHVVLRLWQGAASGKTNLHLISDYLAAPDLNKTIQEMDTVKAIDRLNALKGIDNIRAQFEQYRKALLAHRQGRAGGRFRPHMALLGSPGTGKSTVARLFGDILREDGLLPKGHFIKVTTGELIGQYIGETRPKTRAVCERAKGGVLFIDEAYGLMSGRTAHGDADFGAEAIEVLIQFMEDNDDSLVILAGYTDEINNLINEGNKGFKSRFNKLGFFDFKDYSPEVLYDIAILQLDKINVNTTENFRKALKGIIRQMWTYRNKKFGNARDMENLITSIHTSYANNMTDGPLDVRHIPDEWRKLIDESMMSEDIVLAELNPILGQEGVKAKIRSIYNQVVSDRIKLLIFDDHVPQMPKLNFLFTGNPGTGKTTMAGIIGNTLQRLGVFPNSSDNILTEMKGSDLLNMSTADINKLFEDNIGRILFIDEAYTLRQNPRVVADIVGNATHRDFKDKLSVIMAGYTREIHELFNVNSGLSRRFEEIQFTDYTNEDLYEILTRMVEATPNAVMDSNTCRELGIAYFDSLTRDSNFGNAGEAENLLSKILIPNRNTRYNNATGDQRLNKDFAQRILPDDFPHFQTAGCTHRDNQASAIAPSSGNEPTLSNVVVDCSVENDAHAVSKGSDIYSSVGLIETSRGMGTGFIISVTNRYIVTASHVVEGNSNFSFTLNLGNRLHQTSAQLVWNSPGHDFAILRVDTLPSEAKYFRFDTGTPREPALNIQVMAFPLGRQVSNKAVLTSGAISNYEENLSIRNENGQIRRFNAIRTEAQATHGSSGGPVVLADSLRVIGVLHGGMNESGFFMNIASDISQIFNESNLEIRI